MSRFLLGTLNAIVVILEALLWLRLLFAFIRANSENVFVREVFHITNVFLSPINNLILVRITIFNSPVEVPALVLIFILNIISYAILQIKKGYE